MSWRCVRAWTAMLNACIKLLIDCTASISWVYFHITDLKRPTHCLSEYVLTTTINQSMVSIYSKGNYLSHWLALQWRHNDHDCVSNHQPRGCLLNRLFRRADQRKHQSSESLAFVWGIHRDRWISRTKGQLRGKCFHVMTSLWNNVIQTVILDLIRALAPRHSLHNVRYMPYNILKY